MVDLASVRRIDLGCGRNKRDRFFGIDISEHSSADHVMDIENYSLPFSDGQLSTIFSNHTFEHLSNINFVMNECWRVLEWGGYMFIHVPYRNCNLAWQDPTHVRHFIPESIKFYCGEYLVKHHLDYGIKCAFINHETHKYYPTGKDKDSKKYCTMLQFSLRKDLSQYNRLKHLFPFGAKRPNPNDEYEATLIPEYYDPAKEARKGDLVGGINYAGIRLRSDEQETKPKKPKRSADLEKSRHDPEWFLNTKWKTDHNVSFSSELKRAAKRAINLQAKRIISIKVDASLRYGEKTAPGGEKGLLADLRRKFTRIEGFFEHNRVHTTENIIDTLYDNAVYSILAVMAIEEGKIEGIAKEREDG